MAQEIINPISLNENSQLAGGRKLASKKMEYQQGRKTIVRAVLGRIGNKTSAKNEGTKKETKKTVVEVLKKDKVVHKQIDEEEEIVESSSQPDSHSSEETSESVEEPSTVVHLPMELVESRAQLALRNSEIIDIDAQSGHSNLASCSEYANEIYNYLKTREIIFQIPMDFIQHQPQINERMRAILVDWLVQVHEKFRLVPETLYLTISILDRYLIMDCKVSKGNLQLVGVTAMLLASKIEEIYTPQLDDFVYITDNAYSVDMIKALESKMAASLGFNFGDPLCIHFLRRNSKAAKADVEKHTLAKYFMELMLPDYESLTFPPSQRAAASLCLAMKITDNSPWDATVEHYSFYTEDSLTPCMKRIAQLLPKAGNKKSKLLSVSNKYSRAKFHNIASSPCLESAFITELAEV